ncbi:MULTISPECIES: LLM class flavin-dependent oxidoreductase [Erythrobacteraceae]|uniref:Nitrilotriacetate monooxygenase component A/pristinamycin IIA synthase subunit A n=3 Tax=Sphingomonadales TaxID=204457 RepID=A0A916YMV1_9SPHN|nr:LLM class flavin-dependent oxidoreductase [Croceicoccus pelagius]MEE1878309.1 LLM class flavin-dependent oxidoreductase [Erythrobacteraceae bacterium 1XM1-14]GGC36715.1 nitrilotriacetate monooxygenase component A/pristinamycin IIA synthase subunit A [Novosphingobium marinum]GGD51533.1 nitrilotriacetate monooxygenase component A/pristinamycin IIA synthase subunit A [Croceicoccus pelagius]
MAKQLHLGAFMRPVSIHTGAWRYPGAIRDANFSLKAIQRFIRSLEAAKFDYFFMADHLGVLNLPRQALMRSHTVTSFEPFTLLSALAGVTERIGLVATASTTYEEPFHVARRFASLDHISGGRTGWNVVTTSNPDSSRNFGLETQPDHAARYHRAREFHDVVTGLWDSFADDAFVMDAAKGIYFDPARMRALNHKGEHFSVTGPLNIARPVQGWPVIFQAGASDPGRQLAAETAEAVFAAESTLEGSKAYYDDVKGRAATVGRNPNHIKIMPAVFLVVGDTVEEAHAKRAKLDSLVHYDSGIHSLSGMLGHDVSSFDPDGPLPDIPESNASKSSRRFMIELAQAENLTIRQLAAKAGSYGGLAFVGTAKTIADEMQHWLEQGACDGFTTMFPYLPEGLEDFTGKVVPELQARGLFRTEYEGETLRDHLGLPRPDNRFFA